jgi:alpha-1,2-mannosyltransferase
VLAVAGTAVRAGERLGERGATAAVTATAGLLVSPVSHHHYWVWLVPNTVALAELAVRRRSPLVAAAAAAPLAVVLTGTDVRAIPRRSAVEDPMIALEPGRNVRVNSLTLATLVQLGGVAWHLLRRARRRDQGRDRGRDQGRFRRIRQRRDDRATREA